MSKKLLKPSAFLLPCPVGLITSCGKDEKPNIITLAWLGIISSQPPMVSISVRPSRYSHKLLLENGDFVINIPSLSHLEKVDFCGNVSGKEHDKFKATNYTFQMASKVHAHIITECKLNIECKTKKILNFGSHDVFLAEIIAVQVNQEVLDENNNWLINEINPLAYCPPNSEYWTLGEKVGQYGLSQGKICQK
ncbi:MAG: flavin reductase family protein [Candidatus Firestonebacteria bacterium]|nr:flavin reductase family protein [Candidatus Firestonebacteria bacterium]